MATNDSRQQHASWRYIRYLQALQSYCNVYVSHTEFHTKQYYRLYSTGYFPSSTYTLYIVVFEEILWTFPLVQQSKVQTRQVHVDIA